MAAPTGSARQRRANSSSAGRILSITGERSSPGSIRALQSGIAARCPARNSHIGRQIEASASERSMSAASAPVGRLFASRRADRRCNRGSAALKMLL
jgi:hypothetical protein